MLPEERRRVKEADRQKHFQQKLNEQTTAFDFLGFGQKTIYLGYCLGQEQQKTPNTKKPHSQLSLLIS